MTEWFPSFRGVECGCRVFSDDNQTTAHVWNKCETHAEVDFLELKRLSIEDNIENLLSTFQISTEYSNTLREALYSAHGIPYGV